MGLLTELEEVMGRDATIRLVARRGGQRIYVPDSIHPDHDLAVILGEEAAAALCARWGGEAFNLPIGHKFLLEARRERIKQLRDQGKSLNEIAGLMGCCRRTVELRLAAYRKEAEGSKQ